MRVVLTRQQMFSHVHRPEAAYSVSLGATQNGKLQSIIQDATTSTSRFEDCMEDVVIWGMMNYACDNASSDTTSRRGTRIRPAICVRRALPPE